MKPDYHYKVLLLIGPDQYVVPHRLVRDIQEAVQLFGDRVVRLLVEERIDVNKKK